MAKIDWSLLVEKYTMEGKEINGILLETFEDKKLINKIFIRCEVKKNKLILKEVYGYNEKDDFKTLEWKVDFDKIDKSYKDEIKEKMHKKYIVNKKMREVTGGINDVEI